MPSKTDRLRTALTAAGIQWTAGYWLAGTRTNVDNVTTVWPRAGHAEGTLTFEEEDGVLHALDGITVAQALAMACAGAVDVGA